MRTAKSRAIIRHISVLSLLILLALAAPRCWHWTKAESATTTEGLPSLRGEEAITHLKERGLYDSLGEAVKAARHSAQLLPPGIAPLLAQSARLTAGDGSAEAYFAAAVAISGDTAIVGAPRTDFVANADQGAAYVFTRSAGLWLQQDKLKVDDGGANDFFGFSVAIDGDTALIGAHLNDTGLNTNQGAAYVFTRNDGAWSQTQKLAASDAAAGDLFGFSVALDAETAVIGASGKDKNGVTGAGSAYVFTLSGGTWTPQQKLLPDISAADNFFGAAVAVSGDTALIGSFGDDIGASVDQGSAVVFVRSGSTWTKQQKLTTTDGAAGDMFGLSVALYADTAVIGAIGDDINGADQGSAYVFSRTGLAWSQQPRLLDTLGETNDKFGAPVAISGDTVLVGASFDDVGANANQGTDGGLCPGSHDYTLVIDCPIIGVRPVNPNLPPGQVGAPYARTFTASGGLAPYSFSIRAGALPSGLTLDPAIGVLSGAPAASGTFNFAIQAADSGGCSGMTAYVLTINCPTINVEPANSNLPNGVVGTAYNQTFSTRGGGEVISSDIVAGAPPGGLTLNAATGVLSGAPTARGIYNFVIRATDNNGCVGQRPYQIIVN